jgi:peptidyl-tRNA hydrolase
VQAAQLIHAAGYSSPGNLPDGTYAVALTAKNEAELRALADALAREGLPHHLIVEADAPYSGQATAIGITPTNRRLLKKHLSRFPLLRS